MEIDCESVEPESVEPESARGGTIAEVEVAATIPGWEAPVIRPSVVSAALSRGALLSDDRLEIAVDALTQQPVLRVTRGAVDSI